MQYVLTKDLETGNALIDEEHRELFAAINQLMDACSQGKGRDKIELTVRFLIDYVGKHFSDEERLQIQSKYPGYTAHKQFHDGYKRTISQVSNELAASDATIAALGKLNQTVGVLMNHIRTEDKKVAAYLKTSN